MIITRSSIVGISARSLVTQSEQEERKGEKKEIRVQQHMA